VLPRNPKYAYRVALFVRDVVDIYIYIYIYIYLAGSRRRSKEINYGECNLCFLLIFINGFLKQRPTIRDI